MKNKILNIIGLVAVVITVVLAFFVTKGKTMQVGIKIENMDITKKPGDDFYDYATYGWRKNNKIPDDYSKYGSFEVLANTNLERVKQIAETDDGKIGALYKIAMDEKALNINSINPVKPYMQEIDNISNINELIQYLGKNHSFISAFWSDGVGLDAMNSDVYIFSIGQGGIGLSRDYFFDTDEKSEQIRKKYKEYIYKQMRNFGININVDKIYALEERMAKSFYTKEKLRDPLSNYHKKTLLELKKEFPNFEWDLYFKAYNIQPKFIDVGQPEPIKESIAIINETDIELLKDYLKYRLVGMAESLLDDKTYEIAFDFYTRTMAGQKQQKPRWKRSVALIDGSLGEEIGRLYVEKYFSEDAKQRMKELVINLRRAYEIRIKDLTWMSEDTKKEALKKLATFKAKIGYPDKWRDYSELQIKKDSLFDNMIRVMKFEDDFWIKKIDQKKDPSIWYMNAHEVNAYYDPSANEICFPAGILQYPFFDMSADDAFNYGAIGSVIGHEMTHGFDDSGRHFDKDGNMKDWWTKSDSEKFDLHANIMSDFFDNIEVFEGVHANGKFTLGENLADYGGVTIAFTAYKHFGTSGTIRTRNSYSTKTSNIR